MDAEEIYHDAEDIRAFRMADKVFKFTHLQGPDGPLKSHQGGSPMSEQIKGVIAEKKVDGNRYAFKVDGKWMSCFTKTDTPEEAVKILTDLAPGDTVTFSTYENRGFVNIDGVVEYVKGDASKVPPADKPRGTSFAGKGGYGGGKGSSWKPEDKRPGLVTMTFSYAKDQVSEILKGADMANQSPEAMLKFAETETPKLAKVYLDYCIREAKALGWTPEPKS